MIENVECHVCGSDANGVTEPMEIFIGHRSAVVPVERMRCTSCRTEFFHPGQMEAAQKAAAREMRAAEGLLAPEEVLAIRDGLGLTQPEFERLLGVGAKTVVRWERGTVFQNRATDALLRMIRDLPGAAEYLSAERGVEIAAAAPATPASGVPVDFGPMKIGSIEWAGAAFSPWYVDAIPANVDLVGFDVDLLSSNSVRFSYAPEAVAAHTTTEEDPSIISLESYKAKKQMVAVPDDLLGKAVL